MDNLPKNKLENQPETRQNKAQRWNGQNAISWPQWKIIVSASSDTVLGIQVNSTAHPKLTRSLPEEVEIVLVSTLKKVNFQFTP